MPTILTEKTITSTLTLEFSDKWKACKYDDQKFYKEIEKKFQGMKAVDFLAISKKSILLMEIKYIIVNDDVSKLRFSMNADDERVAQVKSKLTDEDKNLVKITSVRPYLVDEVAKKVKDTLLGLFASYRNSDEELSPYSQSVLMSRTKPILVLLFLERNEQLNQDQFFKPHATNLKLAIEQKLSFLGNIQVGIVNSLTLPASLEINILENTITVPPK